VATPFQLLAEPRRQEILRLVWDRELAAGEIAGRLDVTFGATSQHLRVLREADLVTVRQEGRRRYYRARPERLGPLRAYLEQLWHGHLDDLRRAAERAEALDHGSDTA
jgi:DNA-binding transcriptional ArsR family regulator